MAININRFKRQVADLEETIENAGSGQSRSTSGLNASSFSVGELQIGALSPGGLTQGSLAKNVTNINNLKKILDGSITQLGNVVSEEALQIFKDGEFLIFDELTDLDEEVGESIELENPVDDVQYRPFSVKSGFIDENLKNILVSNSKESKEIDLPRMISHELNKTVYKQIFATNECSILPDELFKLKSNYYNNTQLSFANNYFLSGQNQKTYRKNYYDNLKNNNDLLNKTYKNIYLISDGKEKTKRNLNFGNKITNFYLVESKSSSLGKISNIILNNQDINFTNAESNNNRFNTEVFNYALNNNEVGFQKLTNSKNKIFDIIFSTIDSESSFLKSAKEENFVVNTDRIVGQALVNLSFSLNGFFKDSISYDFYANKIKNSENINSLRLVDDRLYHDIPIIKIDSILSNETDTDLLFNPLNTDSAYTFGDKFFNFNTFRNTQLDNKNNFLKKDFVNEETLKLYRQNLFLENDLNYNSLLIQSDSKLKLLLEDKNIKTANNSYEDFHFNPYNFNLISFRQQTGEKNKFNIAYLDIMPRNTNFSTYRNKLNEISDSKVNFSRSKAILSSTSFTYFLKSNPFNETMTMSNVFANQFDYVCIESVDYLRSNGETMKASLRQFIDPINKSQSFINPTILAYVHTDLNYPYKNLDRSITHGNRLDNENLDYKEYVKKSLRLTNVGENDNVLNEEKKHASSVINLASPAFKSNASKLRKRFNEKNNTLGFMLLENTLNSVPVDRMADKFIKYDSSLTIEEEYIPNRIVMLSSSKEEIDNSQNNTRKKLLHNSIQKNKSFTFKEDNWAKISFDIRNNIFKLKEVKLRNQENSVVIDFLNSLKTKARNITNVTQKTPFLSLLYSDVTKYALDTYESSDFIEKVEDSNFKKFDYSLTSNNVKDTMELKINQTSSQSFAVTGDQTKSFLSSYYPNSIFKSSTVYFEYIKKTVLSTINPTRQTRHYSAYDKLISDAILNEKNIDVASVLAISAIIKYNNVKVKSGIGSEYELINEKTDGLYESYINAVFSDKNVRRQKSYTLRTVDFPSGENGYITRDGNNRPMYNPSNIDFSRTKVGDTNDKKGDEPDFNIIINNHEFDFGIVPGKTYTYTFPFINGQYKIKPNNICSCYKVNEDELMLVDKEQFKVRDNQAGVTGKGDKGRKRRKKAHNNDVRNEEKNTNLEGLYDYVYSKFYNYDVYLATEKGSAMYNFESNSVSIFNCLRAQKIENNNDEVTVKNKTLRRMLTRLTYTDKGPEKDYDGFVPKKLNYTTSGYGITFKEFGIANINNQPALKDKINNMFISILQYVFPDFDNVLKELSDLEKITSFVKDNQNIINIFLNLLHPLCNLYSTVFDEIIELSIKKNIYNKIKDSQKVIPLEEDIADDMWESDVVNLVMSSIENIENKNYSFEKEILDEEEDEFKESLYSQLTTDLQMISRTLNNSDICEIMTMDLLYSYASSFERSQVNNIDILNVLSSLDNIGKDLSIENPNSLLTSKTRLNFISKFMNDYYFYQQKQYENHNLTFQNNLGVDLRDHFDNIINSTEQSFYKNILDIEKNKSILAEQGMMLLNHTYNKYDIMRFGITQEFAEFLSDKKILKFKFVIVSHKNPDLYIPPIHKFYTPMLTDITPSHLSLIQTQGNYEEGVFIDNFVGLYKNSNDIEKIYTVASRNEAMDYVANELINKVNKERILNDSDFIITNEGWSGVKTALDIVSSAVFSSAVKHTNYRTQKSIDEISLNQIDDNLLSSVSFLNTISKEEFESNFSENYESIQEVLDIENIDLIKSETIKNKHNSVDFIRSISKFSNSEIIEKILSDNKYYDVFSVVIGRKDIENLIRNYYDITNDSISLSSSLSGISDDFFDSFSYMVEVEVLWKK